MRLRLLPWVWERVDLSPARPWTPEGWIVQRFKAVANVVCVDTRLAMNVKYFLPFFAPGSVLIRVF